MKPKKILLFISALVLVILITGAFFYIRSPFMSNHLKRIILPELSRISGQRVTSRRIYINLFPFFAGVDDLLVADNEGKKIFSIKKARFYIELLPLLRREVYVSVVAIDSLQYGTTVQSLKGAAGLMAARKSGIKTSGWRIKFGSILLKNTDVRVSDPEKGVVLSLHNISAEGNMKRKSLNLRDAELKITRQDRDVINGNLHMLLSLSDNSVRLKTLEFKSGDSYVNLKGELENNTFDGSIKTDVSIELLSDLFLLKKNSTGSITASGRVRWKAGDDNKTPKLQPPALTFLRGLSLNLDVKGSIYLETLMELLKENVPLQGLAGFSGTVRGPAMNPVAQLTAEMKEGHIYGIDLDSVKCRILYKEKVLQFRDGKVTAYNGNADVSVDIYLSRPTRFSLKVQAESLDSHNILKLIKWDPGLAPGSVTGFLQSEGRAFEPWGTFQFRAFQTEENTGVKGRSSETSFLKKIKNASGSFRMKKHVLTLTDLKASSPRTRLASSGFLDFEKGILRLKAHVTSEDLNEVYYKEGVIKGTGQFEGNVTGLIEDPVISGNISLCNFSYMERFLGCLDAQISYRKSGVMINSLEGKLKDTAYTLRGTVSTPESELFTFNSPEFSLSGTFSHLHLDQLREWIAPRSAQAETQGFPEIANEAKGLLSGDFRLTGPLDDLILAGHTETEELKIKGIYAHLKTDFKYSRREFNLSNLALTKGTSFLRGALSISSAGVIKSDGFTLSLVSDDVTTKAPQGFRIRGNLKVSGSLKSPEGEFNGMLEVSTDNMPTGADIAPIKSDLGDIHLRLKDQELTLDGRLFRKQVSITGSMATSGDLPWKAKIDIAEGLYDDLMLLFMKNVSLKNIPEDLFLSLKGEINLSGTSRSVMGSVLLKSLKLNLYGQNFTNTEDILLTIHDSKIEFNSFSLRTGLAALSINGNLDIEKGYDMTIDGRAYLSPLKGFISGLEYIRGYSDFVLAIKGKWLDPVFNGGLSIEETSFAVTGIPNRFSSIKGYIYIDENRIVLDTLSGRFASGDIRVRGVAQLKGLNLRDFHLEGVVKNVNLYLEEGVSFKLSGELVLAKKQKGIYLIGDMRVLRGRYTRNIEWKSWILSAKKPALPKKQYSFLDSIELNINLYGDEDIIIDNNIATAPARIDLVILGTLKNPSLIGRVELKGGKIFFRNNEFTIINASADFTDPSRINPFFDIVATTRVKEYQIHLSLEGYAEQFNLSLSSEPMLDEIDILSLLTVGELGTKLKGFEGGIGASEAASFLTGKLQETLEERLRNITGFDRIQVEPYVSEITGTIGPKITVSKRLLTDRLYVTYTTSLGNAPEQSLRVEFFLSDNISLVGERDELGTLGADIKFRVEFR
ncbi:hypothetical protein MNBD_NITROSPIRAE02-1200 [hydrothermal vent metagenome]|uniref:Translocation and assembly module TamB C-terminal domain-containing protein n=1 Tax=hydrothermal vent metagenome TaxID=652676 RepID=A0A3B1CFM3_9ZZZZ